MQTKYGLLILSAVLFLFFALLNLITQIMIERFALIYPVNNPPLFDLGFYLIPESKNFVLYIIVNIIPKVFLFIVLVYLLVKNNINAIIILFIIAGTCFAVRSISIIATILPPLNNECVYIPEDHGSPLGNFIYEMFTIIIGLKETCRDYFFSGHMAMFGSILITLLFFNEQKDWITRDNYQNRNNNNYRNNNYSDYSKKQSHELIIQSNKKAAFILIAKVFLYLSICILYGIMLVIVRFHYTIDIFSGLLLPIQIYLIMISFNLFIG